MRNTILAAAVLCLGTAPAFAEVVAVPHAAADPRAPVVQPTAQSAHEAAIVDCEPCGIAAPI
jgi:hypothetical protein